MLRSIVMSAPIVLLVILGFGLFGGPPLALIEALPLFLTLVLMPLAAWHMLSTSRDRRVAMRQVLSEVLAGTGAGTDAALLRATRAHWNMLGSLLLALTGICFLLGLIKALLLTGGTGPSTPLLVSGSVTVLVLGLLAYIAPIRIVLSRLDEAQMQVAITAA